MAEYISMMSIDQVVGCSLTLDTIVSLESQSSDSTIALTLQYREVVNSRSLDEFFLLAELDRNERV